MARLERVANKNDERMRALSAVSSRKVEQGGGLPNENISQRPLKTADDESVIDLVPDENRVNNVVFNGTTQELTKIATEIAKGEIKSLGAKTIVYITDNIAAAAATTAEQKISTNIAKINDSAIEFYASNTALLNQVAKKYPMLNKEEQIELANKQILANASAELLEYSKFLNGGSLPNDARLLGKNAGRMILKSLDAGASSAEVINMLLKAGISGRNSTAAKALLQTGDINAYNAVMRQGEAELIAELANNVRANAKSEIISQILNSAKAQAIKNDEMLKKGIGNQDLDDVTAKFISEKSGKEFEVAENGFGRELMKYEGKEASDDMKRSFSAWEAQGQKADITLNDGRKVVYLSPDEAVELSYGKGYLYGHKSYEELMATKMAESLEQKFNRLKRHPAYENLLKMRENKLAKELKGEKVGGSKPTVYYEPQSDRYLRTAGGGGMDNPEREIRISKSDVAKLRARKLDNELVLKLENSLEALTGDPAASGVLDHLLTRDFHLGTAQYKKGLVQAKTAENSRISSDEVAKTAENSKISSDEVAKSGYLPPLKQEQNKNFQTYDKLISMFEDNLEKRANAYVDFGGSIKQASNGQLDSRFNKKDKVDFLGKYLADYPTPKTISQEKAKSLAFANKENKSLTKQQISDLFGYYKNNEQSKDLLDKNIEYALSKELLEPVINESEKAFVDIAKKYNLPKKFTGRLMDDIRYRHKLVTRATDQTKDQFQISIFKDFAKRLEHLEQNTSFKNSEEALRQNSIKDTEFLIKATPFLKEIKSGGDYVSELNGLKQKAMMDKMSELLAKNASESELEKLVDREYISELAKEAFAKKYGFNHKLEELRKEQANSRILAENSGKWAYDKPNAYNAKFSDIIDSSKSDELFEALAKVSDPKKQSAMFKDFTLKNRTDEFSPSGEYNAKFTDESEFLSYLKDEIKKLKSTLKASGKDNMKFTNEYGEFAIDKDFFGKTISPSSIKNDANVFDKIDHYTAVNNAFNIFKNSKKLAFRKGFESADPYDVQYYVADAIINGKQTQVLFTLRELKDSGNARVYNLELDLSPSGLKANSGDQPPLANKGHKSVATSSEAAPLKDGKNSTTTANKSQENIKSTGKMPEISAGSKIKNQIFKNFMADEGVVQAAIVNDFENFKLFAKNKLDDLLVDAYEKSPDETRKLFDNVIGEFEPALNEFHKIAQSGELGAAKKTITQKQDLGKWELDKKALWHFESTLNTSAGGIKKDYTDDLAKIDELNLGDEVKFKLKEKYEKFLSAASDKVKKSKGGNVVFHHKKWGDATELEAFRAKLFNENSTPKELKSGGGLKKGFSTQAMNQALLNVGSGVAGGNIAMANEDDPSKKAQAFIMGFLAGFGGSAGAMKLLNKNATKLAPQLARVSEKMASELPGLFKDRPDILGGVLGRMNNAKDKFSFIFGGEKALGANKAKLEKARDMAKNGAKDDEIWAKTGWYKDIDGKWKFEINAKGGELKELNAPELDEATKIIKRDYFDKQMNLKELEDFIQFKNGYIDFDAIKKFYDLPKDMSKSELTQKFPYFKMSVNDYMEHGFYKDIDLLHDEIMPARKILNQEYSKTPLNEVLDDPQLFASYPQLKDVKVSVDELKSTEKAHFNPSKNEIVLSSSLDAEEMKSSLYHEIQHAVQKIEGFASGGEVGNLNYKKLAGEAEARNVQTRQAMLEKADKEAGRIISMIKDPQKAMRISKDLANVDEYVMLKAGNKATGAKHIKLRHTSDPNKTGYVSDDEISRLGENMRKFIIKHGEPYFNKENGNFVYEWVENGNAFGLITNSRSLSKPDIFNPTSKTLRAPATDSRSLQLAPFNRVGTPAKDEIITFYSNRNLKTNGAYKFTNPEMTWQKASLPQSQLPHPDKTLDIAPNERIVSFDNSAELGMRESFSPELKASYDMRDKLLKSTNEVRASLNEKGKAELEKLAGNKDSKLSRDAQIMKTLENAKSNPARYEKLKKLYLDENGKVKDSIGLC